MLGRFEFCLKMRMRDRSKTGDGFHALERKMDKEKSLKQMPAVEEYGEGIEVEAFGNVRRRKWRIEKHTCV
jgi:hypothetical protein